MQEAGELYAQGDYREAVELYEQALARTPDLDVGHFNAAITYLKLFRPGDEAPENLGYAEKATEHFVAWLEEHPGDRPVVGMMTTTWLDSGQFDRAVEYWTNEHEEDPTDTETLQILASIHRQAGNWDESAKWHLEEAKLEILG